jgi:hypothetical protein
MLLGDRGSVASAFTLQPDELLAGRHWWTPASALLRYPEGLGLLGLVWTLAIQWVIGSRLEGFWGTTRYLVMVIVAGLVGYASVVGLSLVVPVAAALDYAGPGPMDTAAVVAFAWVFASQRMEFGSVEISPLLVAGIAALVSVTFALLVAVVAGTPIGHAWPAVMPGLVAAVVATLFVQPWRKRKISGKVAGTKQRSQTHLRVVRTPEDMLN